MRARAPCAIFLAAILAGCATPGNDGSQDRTGGGATPSFAVAPPERLTFTMPDGVELVATLWRPEGLERAPVVLHAQPYASGCSTPGSAVFGDPYPQPCRPPTSDEFWLDQYRGAPRALVENGFAFVDLNVRGTGESGGCLDLNGPTESEDLRRVLDALADAEWSTGSLGMMGLSYMGTTPLVALKHRHPALQAVVVGGIATNEYYFSYTPQGAGGTVSGAAFAGIWLGSVVGPQLGGGPDAAPGALARQPGRYCPDFVEDYGSTVWGTAADARPRQYLLDRRHIVHLRDLDAGVLVVQGIPDRAGLQVEPLWDALGDTPKAFVLGDWGHQFPDHGMLKNADGLDWPAIPLAWFDHFLRGGPAPALLGRVQYQVVGTDAWHHATSWPALPSEALYLGRALTTTPGTGDLAFRSAPQGAACGNAGPATWTAALGDPVPNDTLLAGNPMAWLHVEVDRPAATLAVDLWDVPGDDLCAGTPISFGAADLRFLADPFIGSDPPTGRTIPLRVDLTAVSHVVPAGHRLGVTLSSSGVLGVQGRPTEATVVVRAGESHLLLPMANGVGGAPPPVPYPPMPVGPEWDA